MSESPIRNIFLAEAKEILGNLESDIVMLEETQDQELINRIFRYVHTLKGSSGIGGFSNIYEFTHSLENLLEMVRSGKMEADQQIIDLLLLSIDWISSGINESGDPAIEERKSELLKFIKNFMSAESEGKNGSTQSVIKVMPVGVGYNYFRIKACFKDDIFESGIDPLMIIEDVVSAGLIKEKCINTDSLPDIADFNPEKCYISWEFVLKTKYPESKINDAFIFVKYDNDIKIENVTPEYTSERHDEKVIENKRLGDILVKKGIITESELSDVLNFQNISNRKIGDIVIEKGYATEKDIKFALCEQKRINSKIETGTVRVDAKKLDSLLNLLGEIVIGQSAISGIADELQDGQGFRLKNVLYGLDRTTREFQEQIMTIRMIPIGATFEQFRRFVRDAAKNTGKDIKLEIIGEETELDKTVIEKISDPLKHMVRNAVDHGIESPDDRIRLGKNPTGRILLKAYHQEGNVFIDITDDGTGLDRNKIRDKALAMGIIKPGDDVSDSQLYSFIFLPGFTTSENVGDLSGRGVGMDVVRTNVEALRGTVEIETEKGVGTSFRIKMPLTLAIIEGMLVRVGHNIYIIPLLSIVESLKPSKNSIQTIEGKGEVLFVREEYVPVIRLYNVFKTKSDFLNAWDGLVVIVESAGVRIGIMVDDLVGQQQIVIKNIDKYVTTRRSVSGAAILGDGKVALIIDVHGLIGEMT